MKANTEKLICTNGVFDFYIGKYGNIFFAIAYPHGKTRKDVLSPNGLWYDEWTQAGFSRLKTAKEACESWKGWMTKPFASCRNS